MRIEFDTNKNQQSIRERGLCFESVAMFDFETALIIEDVRYDYGEMRYRALGLVNGRLHVLVFTEIAHGIRVISSRSQST